jgi:hypothetical protein
MVTVKESAVPFGRVRSGGVSAVTVGGSWLTVTVASTVLPLRGPAVRTALPTVSAETGTGTEN